MEQQLSVRDALLEELKTHLMCAQIRMKLVARREVQFNVGDLVYVKLRPYHLRSLAKKSNEKLGPRYFGPFKVLKRIGMVAYLLELSPTVASHLVFHIAQLKVLGSNETCQQIPPHLQDTLEWLVELEQVLGVRPYVAGHPTKNKVLIQWKGLPDSEASWETATSIVHHFPDFHLEDTVSLESEGDDKPPI